MSLQKRCHWGTLNPGYYFLNFLIQDSFSLFDWFQIQKWKARILDSYTVSLVPMAHNVSLRQDKYLRPRKEWNAHKPEGMKSGWLRTEAGKSLQKVFLSISGSCWSNPWAGKREASNSCWFKTNLATKRSRHLISMCKTCLCNSTSVSVRDYCN